MRRVLVCADLHGHSYPLQLLLDDAKYKPGDDLLIIIGDMLDRGPDSAGTIKLCRLLEKDGAIILMGNHEIMLLMYLAGKLEEDLYLRNGGDKTIQSYIFTYDKDLDTKLQEDIEWIGSLPKIFELKHYLFVHAGFDPNRPLYNQPIDNYLWGSRDFLIKDTKIDKFTVCGHYQASRLRKDKKPRPWLSKDKLCIGTGADLGQYLSLVELPGGKVYSTKTIKNTFPNPKLESLYSGEVITYTVGE